jgi:hypothetical protein
LGTIDDVGGLNTDTIGNNAFQGCPPDGEIWANSQEVAQAFIDAVHAKNPIWLVNWTAFSNN